MSALAYTSILAPVLGGIVSTLLSGKKTKPVKKRNYRRYRAPTRRRTGIRNKASYRTARYNSGWPKALSTYGNKRATVERLL